MMEEAADEQVLHLAKKFATQTEGELRILHSILDYQKEVKSIDHGDAVHRQVRLI
jgi:predicted RNA-binding protein Jag